MEDFDLISIMAASERASDVKRELRKEEEDMMISYFAKCEKNWFLLNLNLAQLASLCLLLKEATNKRGRNIKVNLSCTMRLKEKRHEIAFFNA